MMTKIQFKHLFFWLAGAGTESLEQCPNWEQRKYVAFGATVLVPTVFALIACGYAVSTLTDNLTVIAIVSVAWAFIILTIDRALLATYRSYQSTQRKLGQFGLRIAVAMLMGITISHPLTLLLFQDTIRSVVEADRETEITEARELVAAEKQTIEKKIATLEAEITDQRTNWNDTFSTAFLVENAGSEGIDPVTGLDPEMKADLDKRIATTTAQIDEKLKSIDQQFATETTNYQTLQGELDHWQKEFEREVNGQRSGIAGLGPRAKSVRDDQLAWRRTEASRIGETLAFLTSQRNDLVESRRNIEDEITAEFVAFAAEEADRKQQERDRVANLKEQVQTAQANQFVDQQNAIRSTIAAQVDTRLEELKRLQGEIALLAEDARKRVEAIRTEPRRDILTQTLALHHLFRAGEEGGRFALTAYLVLTLLFMLIDTIPLVVKFFSKPGPYDTLVDCEEVRFDREREAFLESFHRYMDDLPDGRLVHLAPQNKPLERALAEGVDRSRAAKAFMEHLMELEQAFEESIAHQRETIAANSSAAEKKKRVAMLEEMAQTFYTDLHGRMESFFQTKPDGKPTRHFAWDRV